MSRLLTKGGIVPGTLTNLKTRDKVSFMFNPFEYTISKSARYEVTTVTGQNMGKTSFQSGQPINISLNLYFDTSDTYNNGRFENVRNYTKLLWHMIYVDESSRNKEDKKGIPPRVEFQWGDNYFEGVITQLSEKLTLFSETGTPLRSEVSVSMQQHDDDKLTKAQAQPRWVTTAPSTSTFRSGERLDQISNSNGSSRPMREIASRNGIDNPLKVLAGFILRR
jgi:hypothetical protein